ncbi:biotin transporter BioY [Schaalia cardiffensis]
MSASVFAPTRVLAERFFPVRSLARDVVLVGAAALSVGLLAQVSIPMWPVPITGQTLGVMLAGAILGSRRGASAMTLYATLGLAGVPWFSSFGAGPAYLLMPSFGFILGFIPTAWLIGRLAERRWDHSPLASLGAFGLASTIPFLVGVPWMWMTLFLAKGTALSLWATLSAGFFPFIPGGVVKWLLASMILTGTWKILGARDSACESAQG